MKHMRPAGALLLVAGLSACDVPTGMPRWETTWITPGESTTVSVVELLPAGLGVNADTSAFLLAIDPTAEVWALSEFCSLCPTTGTAPKPPFTATVGSVTPLAASVESAVIASGTIDIALTNNFSFDPLRPGAVSDTGSITIELTSGTTTVAQLVVDGRDRSFAPGSTLNLALQFVPTTVTDDIDVAVTIDSPAGDVTSFDAADNVTMALSSDGIVVSEATVAITAEPIQGAEAELDLADVDIESVNEGTIFFDIENPFGVSGTLTLTIDPADGATITKPLALEPGSTTQAVDFTEEEISRLVGTVSQLSVAGSVSGGSVTVTPDMELSVTTRLRVTIEVGGSDDEEI